MTDRIPMRMVVDDECYISDCGWRMAREWGTTPDGVPMVGMWVLRNPEGVFVNIYKFRNDLADAYNLDLYTKEKQ